MHHSMHFAKLYCTTHSPYPNQNDERYRSCLDSDAILHGFEDLISTVMLLDGIVNPAYKCCRHWFRMQRNKKTFLFFTTGGRSS